MAHTLVAEISAIFGKLDEVVFLVLGEQENGEPAIDPGALGASPLSISLIVHRLWSCTASVSLLTNGRDEFGTNRSKTAMFFSITTFTYFVLGLATGRLADRAGQRKVLLMGSGAMVVGLFSHQKCPRSKWLCHLWGRSRVWSCVAVPMVAGVGGGSNVKEPRSRRCSFRYWRRTLAVVPFSEWLIKIRMENRLSNTRRIIGGVAFAFSCACSSPTDFRVARTPAKRFVDEVISGFCMAHRSCCQGLFFMAFVFMATLFRQSQ